MPMEFFVKMTLKFSLSLVHFQWSLKYLKISQKASVKTKTGDMHVFAEKT